MDMNYHLMFKILLIGDTEVGKSALLHPSVDDSSCSSTIGVHFLKKKLEIGKVLKVNETSTYQALALSANLFKYIHLLCICKASLNEQTVENLNIYQLLVRYVHSQQNVLGMGINVLKLGHEIQSAVISASQQTFSVKPNHFMSSSPYSVLQSSGGKKIKLQVWNITGQERYVSEMFIRGKLLLRQVPQFIQYFFITG